MARRNRAERGRRRKGVVSVDLSDVTTYTPMEEGKHRLKVAAIEEKEGDAGDYWAWKFEGAGKNPVAGSVTHNTSFAPQALFNLKGLLESLEVEIPDSEFDLAIDDMIGLEIMAEVVHEDVETDNGTRRYARIVDHWPVSAEKDKPGRSKKDDDEEERKPARGKKKKELSADDINEMSQDELQEVIETQELDLDLGDFKTVSKMRAAVIDALELEDEEEEAPARSSRGSRRSAKEDEEEDEEEAEEDERPSRRSRRRRAA